MKKREDHTGYKTEDTLKAEAKRRAEEQARLDAEKPPLPAFKKKAENFWYHYKGHVIAAILAISLVIFFVRDVLLRTDPDTTIVLAVSAPMEQAALDALRQAVEAAAEDGNGDGRVYIPIDYIYLAQGPTEEELADMSGQEHMAAGSNTDYASSMKLTTVLAAGLDPIFLLDEAVYAQLDQMANPEGAEAQDREPAFAPLPAQSATGDRLPFSATVLSGAPGCEAFEGLAFSLRPLSKSGDADAYSYCERLLRTLAAA